MLSQTRDECDMQRKLGDGFVWQCAAQVGADLSGNAQRKLECMCLAQETASKAGGRSW